MGWEPRGSAASTGIHHFCQVWPWPRPEHTTGMAQDVGAGRQARQGSGGKGGQEDEREGKEMRKREEVGEEEAQER